VYPRALQDPLPVWIASGGAPQSVARAGALGLPLAIAIIGGEPARFAALAALYREAGRHAGVKADDLILGLRRTLIQMMVGAQPQEAILRSIELLCAAVAPKVRAALATVMTPV
jgi:alkanesulfonate monooxygenase SsuD/methylene tetrahydromethanopterin reductase-like flavin-dependent oxidoreductase (luciferase family)